MHYPNVWPEPFAVCIKITQKLVNTFLSKSITSKTQVKSKGCSVPTNIMWREWAGELIGKPIAAHPNIFSHGISVRIGKA